MKGKHRKHRETGGKNEAEEDLKTRPEPRTNAKEIDREAEDEGEEKGELRRGGRAKRKRGGKAEMKVEGEHASHHAGRKPRKSGGSVELNPFTAARHGTAAKGRKVQPQGDGH